MQRVVYFDPVSTLQALKLFAKAVINHGGIPFELKAKASNDLTSAAIKELESGNGSKAKAVEQMLGDLNIK